MPARVAHRNSCPLGVGDERDILLGDESHQRPKPGPVIVRLNFPAVAPEVVDAPALLGLLE